MAGYETGSMENDPSACVCEHGQLQRKCEVCSEWKPRAIEAEARVTELEEQRDFNAKRIDQLEAGIVRSLTEGDAGNHRLAINHLRSLVGLPQL